MGRGAGVSERVASAGALRAWRVRVAGRRLIRQGRLLVLVLTVAVLASTAVTSVGLLITATEQSAVLTSLKSVPASQTEMSVDVEQPRLTIAQVTRKTDAAIHAILGGTALATPSVRAYSAFAAIPTPSSAGSVGYFGELGGAKSHVKVVHGALYEPSAAGTVSVALPDAAAEGLGLKVGSEFAYSGGTHPVTLRVVGLYDLLDPKAEYWSQDPLEGSGFSSNYLSPTGEQLTAVSAFGPVIVSAGTLDRLGVRGDRVELDYAPSFLTADSGSLGALIQRLTNASSIVPADLGGTATQVSYTGTAYVPLEQIADALTVTQSTVVVVTLLLLVLSIAALAQAARLFNDARAGDRELMRARGASSGQLLGIAFLEAGLVGLITAAVSAPLARLVYFVVASQPAMVAAHVPADAGLPASAWLTSIGLGVLFVLVLIGSLLGRSGSFVSAEQTRSRQRRLSGLLRSGLDLGVVVLAAVAFWQLTIYHSPVGATSTLSVDPVLVAAPALVLLAGSLLAARLFPLLARLVDAWGSRSRGVLFRLASWEIGRRSQRATAVVLLLTLALAVGTFSQTFLATWQQSQVDQADYAVGPQVRVPANGTDAGAQRSALEGGASGTPQPVIRRVADVAGVGDADSDAVVLGLTSKARTMVSHGQLAADGGSVIESSLKTASSATAGIALSGDPTGIAAVAQIGDSVTPMPGVVADVRAVVEDGPGLLATVDLGDIPVDGQPHPVSGMLPTVAKGEKRALPVTVVGVQASVDLGNQATYVANPPQQTNFLLGQLASLLQTANGGYATHPVTNPDPVTWYGNAVDDAGPAVPETVPGWQVALQVAIPPDVQTDPASFSTTSWAGSTVPRAVMSSALAATLQVKKGEELQITFADATISVVVVAITPLIPGAVDSSLLTASAAAGADATGGSAIVIDQTQLERALVENGSTGSLVDEWWVSVPAGTAAAYLRAHPAASGIEPPRSRAVLALQMQQDPLRVATQAALWLAIAAAAILAAIGFAVHSASTLASRRIELAQLRAIGLSRRLLVGLIGAESLLLCVLGAIFGLAVGLLLGWLAGPLIALSPNGTPAVPSVRVIVPWLELCALVLVVIVVLIAVVAVVARGQRSANPANILREADNG